MWVPFFGRFGHFGPVGVNWFYGRGINSGKKIGGLFDPRLVGDRYIHCADFQKSWFGAAGSRVCLPKNNSQKTVWGHEAV